VLAAVLGTVRTPQKGFGACVFGTERKKSPFEKKTDCMSFRERKLGLFLSCWLKGK
jgi:hypothetical protein